jgi:enterochelin esterase-like enzyme
MIFGAISVNYMSDPVSSRAATQGMNRSLLLPLICLLTINAYAQDYADFQTRVAKFYSTPPSEIDPVWAELVESDNVPLVQEDSVAFFYRGEAQSVKWMGDFNTWGLKRNFNNNGKRIPGTNIWILKASFPRDARLDYKIIIDETTWILDPSNPDHQWSGVGGGSPNSELRMPSWQVDPLTRETTSDVRKGKLEKDILLNSNILKYQMTYSVYLPYGYTPSHKYPVIYVTDGNEYLHERMGNMAMVLDNLIHLKKIQPIIAVFLDHREPVDRSNNRRMTELAMNDRYLNFVKGELVPMIETSYSISGKPEERAILGTSMGGLAAAYFAFKAPEVFGLAGIQSPAFWFKPDIYQICENAEQPPVKIIMTTGSVSDAEEGTRKMVEILERNTCKYEYKVVSQGHSWGNWRDLIDDILISFFPYGGDRP